MMKIWMSLFIFAFVSCSRIIERPDTVVMGVPSDIITLDPHAHNDAGSSRVVAQVFNRLLEKNRQGEFVPSLAIEWRMINPLLWEFKLRPNVVFHNGAPLTVEDVVFSLERMRKTPGMLRDLMTSIEEIRSAGEDTFQIKTRYFDDLLLDVLAHNAAGIMHKQTVESLGPEVARHAVGTGAYKVAEHKIGDSVLLQRNEDFFDGAPQVPYILLRNIVDPFVRSLALETKELQISYIHDSDVEAIRSLPYLELVEFESSRLEYLGMNFRKPEFQDISLRRALLYAVDRKGLVDALLSGNGKPLTVPLPWRVAQPFMTQNEYSNFIRKHQIDKLPDFNPPKRTLIFGTPEGYRVKLAEAIQASLGELGIKTEIRVLEYGAFLEALTEGAFDLFLYGKTSVTLNPYEFFYDVYHSNSTPSLGNAGFYENKNLDPLIEQVRREISPEKRRALYTEIADKAAENIAVVPLYAPVFYLGQNKKIKGFYLDNVFSPRFDRISY